MDIVASARTKGGDTPSSAKLDAADENFISFATGTGLGKPAGALVRGGTLS